MSHLLKAEKVRKKTSVSESSPLKRRQTALWTSSSSEVAPLLTPSDAPSDGSLDKLQLWSSASPDIDRRRQSAWSTLPDSSNQNITKKANKKSSLLEP